MASIERRFRAAACTHLLVDHGHMPPVRIADTVHDLRLLRGYGVRARAASPSLYGRLLRPRALARASALSAVSEAVAAEGLERGSPLNPTWEAVAYPLQSHRC